MNRDQAIRVLSEHSDEIRRLGVTWLALFGSMARDQARPDSDIDLLVDIDGRRKFSLLDQVGLQHYFEGLLGRRVEVARREGLKPFLRDGILTEAIEIYPRPDRPKNRGETNMPRRSPRQRLEDMADAVRAIESYTAGKGLDDYRRDPLLRDAVERRIEIVSEASRHVPEDLKARHPHIPWAQVRDVGNILRHGYEIVDHAVIWAIVTDDVSPLKAAVEAMIAAVEQGREG
jgi:uncharacterized protein with HEPN domain/predicted nucleotidyltransferase